MKNVTVAALAAVALVAVPTAGADPGRRGTVCLSVFSGTVVAPASITFMPLRTRSMMFTEALG